MQLLAAMVYWLLVLQGQAMPTLTWPAPVGHAWSIVYGVLSPFVFGFLFTALPIWVNGRAISRATYLTSAALMAVGSLLFYPGLALARLDVVALSLHLVGWAVALLALLRLLRSAPPGDMRQPWAVWVTILLGWLGDASYLAWRISGNDQFTTLAEALAIWGFLTPLFLAVCHRVIPYFTSQVLRNHVPVRPYVGLWAMLAACLTHAVLTGMDLAPWTWPTDLMLSAIALWFSFVWGIRRSLPERLLAMVHIAFLWAGVAFMLFGLDGLMRAHGMAGFGFAPLHALGIGFFGSMLIGMASRVSLGHSGRKLKCDAPTWWLFLTIQLAALIRMLPDLFPGLIDYRVVSLSGLIWLLTFAVWVVRYAPFYWQQRIDGKPG